MTDFVSAATTNEEQTALFAEERHSVSRWWRQPTCQNFAAQLWYSSIEELISMEPIIVTCFCLLK